MSRGSDAPLHEANLHYTCKQLPYDAAYSAL